MSELEFKKEDKIEFVFDKKIHVDLSGPCSGQFLSNGLCAVVEEFSHKISIFDHNFNLKNSFGEKGSQPGNFIYPTDICEFKDNVFVTDRWNHRVQVFSLDGNYKKSFGSFGDSDEQFNEPWGICISADNDILVVDRGNGCIKVFDNKFNYKSKFGVCGIPYDFYESKRFKRNFHFTEWVNTANYINTIESRFFKNEYDVGELEFPENISLGLNGDIYISDRVSGKIVVYDNDFCFKCFLTDIVAFPAKYPGNVWSFDKYIFVLEELSNKIYIINNNAFQIIDLVDFGVKPTACFSQAELNRFYILDAFNNDISVFNLEVI